MLESKRTLQEEYESLLIRCDTLAQRRQDYLKKYGRSLSQRFLSIDYSLNEIRRLSKLIGSTESCEPFKDLDQKRHFYVDCFWAFGYSVFDILAHIINTVHHAVRDESQVSFKRAADGYASKTFRGQEVIPADVLAKLKRTTKKLYFKRLESNRQCCLHRRAVCLRTRTERVSYEYSNDTFAGGLEVLTWICDNASDKRPKFDNDSLLDDVCKTIHKGIEDDISEILGMLRG